LVAELQGKCITYTQQHLQQNPLLADFLDWKNTYTVEVTTDASGNAKWELNQTDSGYIVLGFYCGNISVLTLMTKMKSKF
jgi:hypothetical protein